jgi:hypothetical protein
MHILKVMSNPPNTMIKREKLQSKWQQGDLYKQVIRGMDTELCKGDESEKERRAPKGQELERELYVQS